MLQQRFAAGLLPLLLLGAACQGGAPAAEAPAPAAHQAPGGSAVARHGLLRVQGNRVVDRSGQPVQLRGMSHFWSNEKPEYYNRQAVRWLRDDWKANLLRAAISVHSEGYLKHPERKLAMVDTLVQAATELGMYVIVDWHAHEPEPEAAIEFFEQVARRYGHLPNLIYETWNEPLNTHDWNTVIKPYHERVIARIRAIDPDNLIVAGTQTWSQDVDKAAANPLRFDNVAYTYHFYAGTHREPLREKGRRALAAGIALFVTEWGTSEASGNGPLDLVEAQRWIDFMDEHKLSWAAWSVADKRESSAGLMPGAAATGGWTEEMISPSGRFLRADMRAKNP